MTCPYLAEITMVFCQAAPVKKLIPSDRVSTATACEADAYHSGPLYREALARARRQVEEVENEEKVSSPAAGKGEQP